MVQVIAMVLKIPDLLSQFSNPACGKICLVFLFFYAAKWQARLDHDH